MGAIFKITSWIIKICPYAVFAITAWMFATQGTHTIWSLFKLLIVSYIGLIFIFVVLCVLLLAVGERPLKTFKAVSEPFLLGVGSRASEVTLPIHLEKLIEMGVPKGIASVVLPLAYVFNKDASIMYSTLAVGFVIDLYNIPMTWQTLLSIVILMTVLSKGSPNMPSGTLVMVALVLAAIGLPVEGVAVILGIDAFIDMGRTGLNIISNTVAIKVIMKICDIKYEQVGVASLAVTGD
jgi:DAACS family dicarboxylate/amino acid:cation (Na+ or H+) symporter